MNIILYERGYGIPQVDVRRNMNTSLGIAAANMKSFYLYFDRWAQD